MPGWASLPSGILAPTEYTSPVVLFDDFSPLDNPNLFSLYVGLDPGSGSVATWTDRKSSKSATQATGTKKPTAQTSAVFGGKQILSFDGGDDVKCSTAADSQYLHDGTGMTAIVCLNPTSAVSGVQVVLDTCNSSTLVGFMVYYDGPNKKLTFFAANNTPVAIINQATANNSAPLNTAAVIVCRYLEGRAGNEWALDLNGTSIATGNSAAAPSAVAPTNALTIGDRGNEASNWFTGEIPEVQLYKEYCSDAFIADAYRDLRARWSF